MVGVMFGVTQNGRVMTEHRCSTCRHWDQDRMQSSWRATIRLKPLDGEDPHGHAIEERQRAVEARYGQCKAIDLLDSYETTDAAEVPVAFTRDGSDYKAEFYTRDDFGCTSWEGKAPSGGANLAS